MRYLIVIVKEKNYGAFCPDIPGCVAIGDTIEECKKSMQEALAFHLEGDETLPVPHTSPDDPEIAHNPDFIPVYVDIDIPNLAA
ncbi:MAG TPA: type II toxin-antitoxin system HicB family antitoxin [Ktedonobacteraceae bacterium]|nr:type II toxin-antitoxin system HicB family antitoxin [Ktedonobacteraceae bacterium]